MKKVFENSMVAHIWAQQSQSEGRSGNGNFYFQGKTIYSYGGHFPIARFVTNDRQETAILFTTDSRSVSTARHISYTRTAIRNLPQSVLYVPRVEDEPLYNLISIKDQIKRQTEHLVKLSKRATRQFSDTMAKINTLIEQGNELIEFFSIPNQQPLEFPTNLDEVKARVAEEVKREEESRKKAIEETKLKIAKLKEEALLKLEKWKNNLIYTHNLPYVARDMDCLLRVRLADGSDFPAFQDQIKDMPIETLEIETSWGASFPASHAKLAFKAMRHCHDNGEAWWPTSNSIRLGHFTVNSIDAQGNVKAGCHFVKWEEIERIASILGIYP